MQPKEKTKRNKTVIDISSTTESLSNIVTMEHVNIHGSSLERFKKQKNGRKVFHKRFFMVIFTDVHHTFIRNQTPSVKHRTLHLHKSHRTAGWKCHVTTRAAEIQKHHMESTSC